MRASRVVFVGLMWLAPGVRAEDHPVTPHPVRDRAQQAEREVKTERDRPHKEERARAAAGRVEDGVRDFGRGLQKVMGEAGLGGPPPASPKVAKPATPKKKTSAGPSPAAPVAGTAKPSPAANPAPVAGTGAKAGDRVAGTAHGPGTGSAHAPAK